ncbi:MAG: hypothetical protein ACYC6W_11790 [Nitrosotalea sp.]
MGELCAINVIMRLPSANLFRMGLNGAKSLSLRDCLGLDAPIRIYQALEYFNSQGIQTYNSPMQADGQLIHGLNIVGFPVGGYSKRPGYGTFGTSLGTQVNSLFSYAPYPTGSNGTNITMNVYVATGSLLQYSAQGTGAWTIAGNGTINNGNHVGWSVLNNVLILGDGVGSTRHTSNGTSFTNTTDAPVAQYFSQFHNRIYASDSTTSNMNYSVTNDATNWANSGTSDSSFFVVANEGGIVNHFVAGDRLVISKQRGDLFNWDDTSLVDMSTKYGPSSPWGVSNIDDTYFYINQYGIFSFDGANKNLISNPIQRHFYNRLGSQIGTASWGTAPSVGHIWDYLVAVGTVTDDFTMRTVNNAIERYDFQKNQFTYWSFNDAPTAFHSFNDISNRRQLIFGGTSGQVFQTDITKTSDNGASIETEMVFLFNYSSQGEAFSPTAASTLYASSYEKKWDWILLFFNPGDEVNIQYAFSNTLTYQHLIWSEAINTNGRGGDYYQVSDGVVEIRFPRVENNMPRARFLFVRIYDKSDSSAWTYYGCRISASPMVIS